MRSDATPAPAEATPDQAPDRPKRGPGRPRKTDAERHEGNRRRELLTAAARLFRQQGFDATSTRDVAAAAGMQSGSPFYHFRSKGDLLFAVMERGMRDAIDQQTRMLQKSQLKSDDWMGQMRDLIQCHCRILHGRGQDFIRVMLHEWRALPPPQQRQLVALQDAYEAPWRPVLQALFERGQLGCEPRLARPLLLGALNWSMHWFDARQRASVAGLADAVAALLLLRPEAVVGPSVPAREAKSRPLRSNRRSPSPRHARSGASAVSASPALAPAPASTPAPPPASSLAPAPPTTLRAKRRPSNPVTRKP